MQLDEQLAVGRIVESVAVVAVERHGNDDLAAVDERAQVFAVDRRLGDDVLLALGVDLHRNLDERRAEPGLDLGAQRQPVGDRAVDVQRVFRVGRPFGIEVLGEHVHDVVVEVDAVDVIGDVVDLEGHQVVVCEQPHLLVEQLAHLGVVLVQRAEERTEGVGVVQIELGYGAGDRLAVRGGVPDQLDDLVQLGVAYEQLVDEQVEQRGDVGLVGDEPPDVDIGVGQFGGQPDVRLAEDVFDVDAVVGDLLHAHADGHERAAEFTLRIADGDVVRFDIFQIVLLVDASCGEQPDKEQKRQFFHRRSMMGGW